MTIKFLQEGEMGMRGKREAGNREEAGLPQGTEKEELRVTGFPCRSMGMTREDESGRSMVEMLGVLAIMGLLAIGGIGMRWINTMRTRF